MKFRKRPVIVDAVQWFPGVQIEGVKVIRKGDPANLTATAEDFAFIETLEGEMRVSPGDWVVTGVIGERYPCKPDVFAATHEPVEPAAVQSLESQQEDAPRRTGRPV